MSNIRTIDAITLHELLKNDEVILIDVRELVEYQSCSIPNAKHLPLSEVTIDRTHLPEHENKQLVFHCKSGKRSAMACEKLLNEGIDFDIYTLEGGIDAWIKNDFSTISLKKILPLERQMHITISILILSGLTLNFILNNSLYLILPLITGLGLLNAGITGWCGMGKLIARMPWNK